VKYSNDPTQGQLFNPFDCVISPIGRRHIADVWQGMFRDVILQFTPVAKVGERFCDDNGRPTAELYSIMGLLMIGVSLRRFFAKVDRHHGELLQRFAKEESDNELLQRYRKQSDSRIFGDVRGTEARRVVLQRAAEDLHRVITYFQTIEPVAQWKTYLQLETIFDQQCEVREQFDEIRQKTRGNVIIELAKKKDVELVAPVPGSKKHDPHHQHHWSAINRMTKTSTIAREKNHRHPITTIR
jgi:hypothetical protein